MSAFFCEFFRPTVFFQDSNLILTYPLAIEGGIMTYADIYGARSLIAFVAAVSFLITFFGTWKKESFLFSVYLSVLISPSMLLIYMTLNVLFHTLIEDGFGLELFLVIPLAAVFLIMGIHIFIFYGFLGILLGISSGFLLGNVFSNINEWYNLDKREKE